MLDIETDSDNHELIAELIALESELAKRNLYTYVEQMWPQIEPATPFVGGFHLGAVCEHKQAVFEGQIEKLRQVYLYIHRFSDMGLDSTTEHQILMRQLLS